MQLDWRVENAKMERLDLLYTADGRHDPEHPSHGLYTGLIALAPSTQGTGTAALPTAAASADEAEQPMQS